MLMVPNAHGVPEALLFRRLQALAATKRRLAVNTKLPIPSDASQAAIVSAFFLAEST